MHDIIRVDNLTKSYFNEDAAVRVLNGLTFTVPRGQFLAIMGPSGSGKSTLMHILGFLDALTGGSYLFDGRDVSTLSEDELARMRGENVGFVFQSFHLLPKTSVLENVKLPLLYSDVPLAKRDALAKKAIEIVGLAPRMLHLSNQLSGGERQRVAIARALVRRPSVIFADEPTGNLDSKSGTQIMDTLWDLNHTYGHTIILVTHERYTAEYAERVLQLRDGKIVGDNPLPHRRASDNGQALK